MTRSFSLPSLSSWEFDIDRYVNPFIPKPPWPYLPGFITRFLGHHKRPLPDIGNLVMIFWAFIGVFTSLALIGLISHQIPVVAAQGPTIIGSFGAAAILGFYAIESPLAQPRNAIGGQLLSSIVGVIWCKILQRATDSGADFAASPTSFATVRWLGGALACASATAIMALTGTVHPPAASTALMAVIDDSAVALDWFLVPLALLGAVVMLCVSLLLMNLQRRFPLYWWTPEDVGQGAGTRPKMEIEEDGGASPAPGRDLEAAGSGISSDEIAILSAVQTDAPKKLRKTRAHTELVITRGKVHVPAHVHLTPEEKMFLESLCDRLPE